MSPAPRRVDGRSYQPAALAASRVTAGLVIPARDEAAGIRRTVQVAMALQARGVLDQVLVVDGGSEDGTADVAAAEGAKVVAASDVLAEHGPVLGKGDSLWRGLSLVETDVVAFLDADLQGEVATLICGLIGPVMLDEDTDFVKGSFHRIAPDGAPVDDPFDGGRVTELMARPLLNLWRPDLAAFYQPLSGQIAGQTNTLRSLPMLTGYAVEITMLADVVDRVGIERVVESELGSVRNRPKPTSALAPMAQEVLYGLMTRVLPPGARPAWQPYARPGIDELTTPAAVAERPPLDEAISEL